MPKYYDVKLTEQQINDLLNCISATQHAYNTEKEDTNLMAKNNPNFLKAVEALNKKLWKVIKRIK